MSAPAPDTRAAALERRVVKRTWGYAVHRVPGLLATAPTPVQLVQDELECGHTLFAAAPPERRPCPCCLHAHPPAVPEPR
jgi:hypothetical protein